MKRKVLNLFFKKELEELRKEAGIEAFVLAQKDIREGVIDDIEDRAEILSREKLSKLLTIVDESQVVSIDPRSKTVYIGGERATNERIANLRAEAAFLLESDLWNVLYETPKKLAQDAMFKDDGTLDNLLLKGRAILYTLATQDKIVRVFKELSTGPVDT